MFAATCQKEILALEEKLKVAMLSANIAQLEQLLAPSFIYTDHQGRVFSQQACLHAYQMGTTNLTEIEYLAIQMEEYEQFIVLSLQIHLKGLLHNDLIDSRMRISHVWRQTVNNPWQLILSHAGLML